MDLSIGLLACWRVVLLACWNVVLLDCCLSLSLLVCFVLLFPCRGLKCCWPEGLTFSRHGSATVFYALWFHVWLRASRGNCQATLDAPAAEEWKNPALQPNSMACNHDGAASPKYKLMIFHLRAPIPMRFKTLKLNGQRCHGAVVEPGMNDMT